jgi:alcohol dehydrogenase, propanol-preferring
LVFQDIRLKGSLLCSPLETDAIAKFIAKKGITVKTNVFYGLESIEELTKLVYSGKIQERPL